MSLAIPTNIATHDNLAEILRGMMRSLSGRVTLQVWDGRLVGQRVDENEIGDAADSIVGCRFVYVLDGGRGGRIEPIAAFIANESLGWAQLYHLIDDQPPVENGKLPPNTTGVVGVYIRCLFADNEWLNAVTVPAVVDRLDGQFGMKVTTDDGISTVTLADAGHRPRSSRRWA